MQSGPKKYSFPLHFSWGTGVSSAEQIVYLSWNEVFQGNFLSHLEVEMGIDHGLFLLSMIIGNLMVDDRNNLLRAPANSSHSSKISIGIGC